MGINVNHIPGAAGDMYKMLLSILIEGDKSIYYSLNKPSVASGYMQWDVHFSTFLHKTHTIAKRNFTDDDTIIIPKTEYGYTWMIESFRIKSENFKNKPEKPEQVWRHYLLDIGYFKGAELDFSKCNLVYLEDLLDRKTLIEALHRTILYYKVCVIGSWPDALDLWDEWRIKQYDRS
jgi:hypothetical protein